MRALEPPIDTNEPGWELVEERLNKLKMIMKFCFAMRAGRKASFWGFK